MALDKDGEAIEPPAALNGRSGSRCVAKRRGPSKSEFAPDAVYGSFFRVGREGAGRTFPVGGGSLREAGMAVPRAIGFKKVGSEMVGQSGQTSTQIVLLKKPIPESYMILPLGQSDHKESGHFDDQAEKLFSRAKAKPTFFMNRPELEKHQVRRMDWPTSNQECALHTPAGSDLLYCRGRQLHKSYFASG